MGDVSHVTGQEAYPPLGYWWRGTRHPLSDTVQTNCFLSPTRLERFIMVIACQFPEWRARHGPCAVGCPSWARSRKGDLTHKDKPEALKTGRGLTWFLSKKQCLTIRIIRTKSLSRIAWNQSRLLLLANTRFFEGFTQMSDNQGNMRKCAFRKTVRVLRVLE